MKQFFDKCAYVFTGALVMAFVWFIHESYGQARQMGYTPDAREHMANLVAIYNSPNEVPSEPIRLSVDDLK